MDWTDWAPTYHAILDDFGWDPDADADAARGLASLVPPAAGRAAWRHLATDLRRRPDAVVVGCGPVLERLRASDLPPGIVVAADGATLRLQELGVVPRVVVTDLDGDPDALRWAAEAGATMVVHAHGDNRERLGLAADWPVVAPSCQSPAPEGAQHVRNHGGFTDGDRAALLCEAMEVRRVRLVAFDLDATPSRYSHHYDPETKARKLAWAGRILSEAAARADAGGPTRFEQWVPA